MEAADRKDGPMTLTISAAAPVVRRNFPGVLLSGTIGAAAAFLGSHYGAPVMLFALLLGIAFNFLADDPACRPGIDLSSRFLLRLGVGLLGLRIGFEQIVEVGVQGVTIIAFLVSLTIATGFVASRLFGRQWRFALLTGGAVAICGASAALAIAAVIPHNDKTERDTLFTVIAVTTLSTVAMVAYPVLFDALSFSEAQTGFLIGATIHDVAQVVGAGYSVSETAGDKATVVKLFRVALLPVVLIAIVLSLRMSGTAAKGQVPLLPWFMVMFVALSLLKSITDLPDALLDAVEVASRTLLVTAIAALGIKTSLRAMRELGGGHIGVVTLETLVLLGAAVTLLTVWPVG
jgi:uncharacterized integral membrane protein (TIGR00698 family)